MKADADQVLDSARAQELLHSRSLARIGYVGADGYPRVIPIGYLWKNRTFVMCTASNAPKVAALQANPRVGLTIDTETHPPLILLVRGRATVEIVDGVPQEYLDASKRYIPPEEWDGFVNEVHGLYKQMARISMTPEWAKLIDFETSLPVAVERLVGGRPG
jgi:hypothetical protein